MKKLFIIFLGFSTLSACKKDTSNDYMEAESYFDLPTYIVEGLTGIEQDSVLKTSSNGLDTEVLKISKEEMLKSLEFLSRIDINKSAWKGKFIVDSISSAEGLEIKYTQNDPKINIEELSVLDEDKDGKIDQCTVIKQTDSPLSSWSQKITFHPKNKRLEILNELDKTLGKEKESYIKLAYEW